MNRLCKSKKNKKIFGVCGGFAEYFGIDATLVRIFWTILVICFGTGILAYIISAILMPKQ